MGELPSAMFAVFVLLINQYHPRIVNHHRELAQESMKKLNKNERSSS